eukprot:CAMPEP_0197851606 /NCGR_PEP_ID=MMETSP1438-20131217/18447_1 /TAXON_ID=1461541 /ORGANISM="Pterosperma sp., Strain CCMP1384" /LENGTH=97 /DNA_ID=CAMNT_0043465265 /DNA_START=547 /DNA_END=840 /DNA_ORIENTATION=+
MIHASCCGRTQTSHSGASGAEQSSNNTGAALLLLLPADDDDVAQAAALHLARYKASLSSSSDLVVARHVIDSLDSVPTFPSGEQRVARERPSINMYL